VSVPAHFADWPQWRQSLYHFVEGERFNRFIIIVILLNAAVLGAETSPSLMAQFGTALKFADTMMLGIFIIEIFLRLAAHGRHFVKSGWHWFDVIIVAIALLPDGGPFAVLRAMRVLRALRLIARVPSMRRVVGAIFHSLPGLGSTAAFMLLLFYISSVMATVLYGQSHPQWFGTIGDSAYSLFQIMTLESWSMGIVRPVMEVHPQAYIFFVPFVLITTFMMLNMVVAILVDSMNSVAQMHELTHDKEQEPTLRDIRDEVRALRAELETLRKSSD